MVYLWRYYRNKGEQTVIQQQTSGGYGTSTFWYKCVYKMTTDFLSSLLYK